MKKTTLRMIGGFVVVSVMMFFLTYVITVVSDIDPFSAGRYLGMAIFFLGILYIIVWFLQLWSHKSEENNEQGNK